MPKSIATRKGDDGLTGLIAEGRVSKASPRIIAMGSLDELVAQLGVARALCSDKKVACIIKMVQYDLFNLGASLATPIEGTSIQEKVGLEIVQSLDKHVAAIESKGVRYEWSVPGDRLDVAVLEVARTICRRAECNVVALKETGGYVNPYVPVYLNRLADLLWLLGRLLEKNLKEESE